MAEETSYIASSGSMAIARSVNFRWQTKPVGARDAGRACNAGPNLLDRRHPDSQKFAVRITSHPGLDISIPFEWNTTSAEVTEPVYS
jgi:hypothetical protein